MGRRRGRGGEEGEEEENRENKRLILRLGEPPVTGQVLSASQAAGNDPEWTVAPAAQAL